MSALRLCRAQIDSLCMSAGQAAHLVGPDELWEVGVQAAVDAGHPVVVIAPVGCVKDARAARIACLCTRVSAMCSQLRSDS